jgi:hypothetical protein
MGVRTDDIVVVDKDCGEFFSSMKIVLRQDDFKWEIVNVYGPVQMERKASFLEELNQKISRMEDPFIIGGDFNLIRFSWEKSTGNVNQFWMSAFNDFIRDNGIKEMDRKGCKYTWTNKQENPIMSVLDRVFTCTRWDHFYKKASCETLTRVGSDHCPNVVNTDDHRFQQKHGFHFEMPWLLQREFREQVVASWPHRGGRNIQDFWREIKSYTRRFCKGWGANANGQIKKKKRDLLEKLKNIDSEMEINGLNVLQWQQRFRWEGELEGIYQFEEIQWQRRGGVKWILEGDSNSRYFHGKANGRKKKCTIFALEDGERVIREPKEIREHVESYYKTLFGKEQAGSITLGGIFGMKEES